MSFEKCKTPECYRLGGWGGLCAPCEISRLRKTIEEFKQELKETLDILSSTELRAQEYKLERDKAQSMCKDALEVLSRVQRERNELAASMSSCKHKNVRLTIFEYEPRRDFQECKDCGAIRYRGGEWIWGGV